MPVKRSIVLRELKQLLLITLACAVYSASWTALILPYGIVSGGVAGLSSLLYYVAHIPASLSYAVVNAVLFITALKILGMRFFAKTIYASNALPASTEDAPKAAIPVAAAPNAATPI